MPSIRKLGFLLLLSMWIFESALTSEWNFDDADGDLDGDFDSSELFPDDDFSQPFSRSMILDNIYKSIPDASILQQQMTTELKNIGSSVHQLNVRREKLIEGPIANIKKLQELRDAKLRQIEKTALETVTNIMKNVAKAFHIAALERDNVVNGLGNLGILVKKDHEDQLDEIKQQKKIKQGDMRSILGPLALLISLVEALAKDGGEDAVGLDLGNKTIKFDVAKHANKKQKKRKSSLFGGISDPARKVEVVSFTSALDGKIITNTDHVEDRAGRNVMYATKALKSEDGEEKDKQKWTMAIYKDEEDGKEELTVTVNSHGGQSINSFGYFKPCESCYAENEFWIPINVSIPIAGGLLSEEGFVFKSSGTDNCLTNPGDGYLVKVTCDISNTGQMWKVRDLNLLQL